MDEQRWEELSRVAVTRHVIGVTELLPLALPQAFLIENAIPKRGITFISGAPGSAKSWLAYDLVMRAARQESWLGRRYVDQDAFTNGCLVLNYDNPTALMAQRFVQLGATSDDPIWFHTRPPDDPNAVELRFPLEDESEHLERLVMIVSQLRPKLILIDSFRQAHDADENDAGQVAKVLRGMKRLLALGATIAVIHHSTKAGGSLRGSGAIAADADATIDVTGEDGERQAWWEKHRGWAMPMALKAAKFDVKDVGKGAEKRTVIDLA